MSNTVSIKEKSKVDIHTTPNSEGQLSTQIYQLGAILRIADSLESIDSGLKSIVYDRDLQYAKVKRLEAKCARQKKFIEQLKQH